MRFGFIALAAVLLLIGGACGALLLSATDIRIGAVLADPYIRHVLGFTFWQAGLSALLSVGLAIPVARAFARQSDFPGRRLLLRIFLMPMVTPVIVAVFGIVAVHGQSGWITRALGAAGAPPDHYLYGLTGILIAHLFFNLPLATRLLLQAWDTVPGETWRLAQQLGLGPGAIFRLIEWPLLRERLPGAAMLVFLLCFVSFATVLALGGGPAATTLEVAIYQALRFDFDLDRAVALALLQTLLCGALLLFAHRFALPLPPSAGLGRAVERDDRRLPGALLLDGTSIFVACLIVLLPLLATAIDGLTGPIAATLADPAILQGLLFSLGIALMAGFGTTFIALGLAHLIRGCRARSRLAPAANLVELAGMATVLLSPLALGTGFFLLLRGATMMRPIALAAVMLINALMAMPYAMRILVPAMLSAAREQDRLCAALGLSGWNRWRLIDWPGLRRPIGMAFGFAAALSVGDLGAIALFGGPGTATLPLLLYQQLGAYRVEEAAVTALLLLLVSLGLYSLIERGVGGHASA